MKTLVFDAGPLISLSMAGLLDIIPKLKLHFKGKFLITPEIHNEIVDKPLKVKRFMLEALKIRKLIASGTIDLIDEEKIRNHTLDIMQLANSTFYARKHRIKIIHDGEASVLAASAELGSSAVVVDERTTRMIIESPEPYRRMMQSRLRTKVAIDNHRLTLLKKKLKDVLIIRSAELCFIATELGLLSDLRPEHDSGKMVAEAAMWAVKFNGCAISESEIAQGISMLKR